MPTSPTRILCLADDLSGLAEVAGQVAKLGFESILLSNPETLMAGLSAPKEKPLFVNLASRNLPHAEAKQRVLDALAAFEDSARLRVYLKVDSAARGPIRALVEGILQALTPPYLPFLIANPSRGRVTQAGAVWIDGTKLEETSFRRDPHHPIAGSYLPEILGGSAGEKIQTLSQPGEHPGSGICVLDASTEADVEAWAAQFRGVDAAVGAAPFGVQLIRFWMVGAREAKVDPPEMDFNSTLFVVGTNHPAGRRFLADLWKSGCALRGCGEEGDLPPLPLAIHTPESHLDPSEALRTLVETAKRGVEACRPISLLILGGETAQALALALNLSSFRPLSHRDGVAFLDLLEKKPGSRLLQLAIMPGSYYSGDLMDSIFPRTRSGSFSLTEN